MKKLLVAGCSACVMFLGSISAQADLTDLANSVVDQKSATAFVEHARDKGKTTTDVVAAAKTASEDVLVYVVAALFELGVTEADIRSLLDDKADAIVAAALLEEAAPAGAIRDRRQPGKRNAQTGGGHGHASRFQ